MSHVIRVTARCTKNGFYQL